MLNFSREKIMRKSLATFAAFVLAASPALAGDPIAGQAIFKSQCSACHSPVAGKNLVGPSLSAVVGRTTGQIAGFHYSAANKAAGLTLDAGALDRYLASPKTVIPGTTMTYAGLKDDAKRADLIAYLETLK